MAALTLEVSRREVFGSTAVGRLRRAGKVPAILYGMGKESVPLTADASQIDALLKNAGGQNVIFELSLEGTEMRRSVMIKDMERHPIRGDVEHCDFIRISMDETVQVKVPVSLVGLATGVKNQGGILEFMTRELAVECLPNDIPDEFEVDVSPLDIGDAIRVKDIEIPERVNLTEAENQIVAHVVAPKKEAEVAVAEEEEVAEGATEGEPEVAKKGKEGDEPAPGADSAS